MNLTYEGDRFILDFEQEPGVFSPVDFAEKLYDILQTKVVYDHSSFMYTKGISEAKLIHKFTIFDNNMKRGNYIFDKVIELQKTFQQS